MENEAGKTAKQFTTTPKNRRNQNGNQGKNHNHDRPRTSRRSSEHRRTNRHPAGRGREYIEVPALLAPGLQREEPEAPQEGLKQTNKSN